MNTANDVTDVVAHWHKMKRTRRRAAAARSGSRQQAKRREILDVITEIRSSRQRQSPDDFCRRLSLRATLPALWLPKLMGHTHPNQALEYLDAAMDLLRGRPFEGVLSDPAYQWAAAEGWEATAIEKVTDAAHRLASLYAERGEYHLALAALRKGLEISPDSTLLREDLIRLAADTADRRVAWREAVSALGASEAERTLGSLYRRYDDADA